MRRSETEVSEIGQEVLFPAITEDYRLVNGEIGLAVVANRNIKKGELIFADSIEFIFADVQEDHDGGDQLYLCGHNQASRVGKTKIPPKFPLTREVLTQTHGVPFLKPDPTGKYAGIASWQLEVPGMLMNHSCDPNAKDDSHDAAKGECYAVRDIKKGEEITCDYVLQFYDIGPKIEECLCGSANCRGSMVGFKALSDEDKERLLPDVSEVVKAMYLADLGLGPEVKIEQTQFPRRLPSSLPAHTEPTDDIKSTVMRLVFPGPNCANAIIAVEQDEENGKYELRALKDFHVGEQVYEFWRQPWPHNGESAIDMVFASKLSEGDPVEGTMVRVDPHECGASRDRRGRCMFSGWDLFTAHSCEPNIAYNDYYEDEDDNWHAAYAVREIKKGDRLTVDFNSILWDRTDSPSLNENDNGRCHCGSINCTGTIKGFKFLSADAKEERKSMSYLRLLPPNYDELDVTPGEALSTDVRVMWRKYSNDAPSTGTESSSGSEDDDDASTSSASSSFDED